MLFPEKGHRNYNSSMSHKRRSHSLDYLVYLLVRIIVAIVQSLPFGLACGLANCLAWLFYHVDRRHRLVAMENLRHAFPNEYTDAELAVLVHKVYRHFCLMLLEMFFLPRLVHLGNWQKYFQFGSPEDAKRLIDLWLGNRPILMATGHFGNWEISSYVLGLLGLEFCGIARPLDNPFLDSWMLRFREAHGQKILAKKGDFDQIQDVLAKGGMLGTLVDRTPAAVACTWTSSAGRPPLTRPSPSCPWNTKCPSPWSLRPGSTSP